MLNRSQYDQFRVSPPDPATLRASHVEQIIKRLADSSGGRLRVERYAESFEGRPIYLLTLGDGPRRMLMWSQMHGDEPTHTAVVLDLFSYLLHEPAAPLVTEILAGCTLMFIPMLNPDGAEAVTRFNAQGVDINRDWRRQATPEGRALLRAAKILKPQFAFNLHNQNARTCVGRPPRPAAVSVLAPAPDASRKETPSWRAAKQMCSCFVEAVRPHAEGMISRYDDEYEPRAFGDGIQSLGVSTMLVEAGGWPEADIEPMTRLHFHGMLNTIHAIATDRYRSADVQIYDDLPESNQSRLSDCLITKANVLDARAAEPFVVDLLVDQSHTGRLARTTRRDGTITDIGDLPGISARLTIDASNALLFPGQFTFVEDWGPAEKLDEERIARLLSQGTTTVIGVVDLNNRESMEAIPLVQSLPFNWAFVGYAKALSGLAGSELAERIAVAAAHGLAAVISNGTDETLWRHVNQFGLPLVKPAQLLAPASGSYLELAKRASNSASAIKHERRRGRINRGYLADLLLIDDVRAADFGQAIDWSKLSRVMVAGDVVWENGQRTGGSAGVLLRS